MNPWYFAVLPAEVRYDANIEPSAKLLYAEITALSNKTGECFASNAYFAWLYGVDDRTVRRWKSSLENAGYIETCKTNWHVFLIGQGRTKMSGGADKNVRALHIVYLIINLIIILIIEWTNKKKKKNKTKK